jgi:hypothetical protein
LEQTRTEICNLIDSELTVFLAQKFTKLAEVLKLIEKKCDDDFDKEFNQKHLAEVEYNLRNHAVIGDELLFEVVEDSPFKIQDYVKQYLEELSFRFV